MAYEFIVKISKNHNSDFCYEFIHENEFANLISWDNLQVMFYYKMHLAIQSTETLVRQCTPCGSVKISTALVESAHCCGLR